jgi:O-antigen ligase
MPLYIARWRIGPLPTTLLEALIGVTVVAYLVTLYSEKRLPRARTPYDIPIILLLIAGVIGIVVAPDHLKALGTYRAYFIEAIVCFYIAVDLLRSRADITTFLLIAGAGVCLMAVGELADFAYAVQHHNLDLSAAPSFLNTSANSDAMYFEPPLAFALAFTLFPSRPRERWVAGAGLVLIFAAFIASLSRASFLALAILVAVLVLSARSLRWRLRALAGAFVVALVVLEIPFVNRRFLTFADSVTNRESIYKQTVRMLEQFPIFGAGLDGFGTRVAPYRPAGQIIQIYPHDIWLTFWSELGLLGLVAFALIFFGLLWRAVKTLPFATDIYRPLLWGAIGALILYTVHGLFDSPYWKNDLSVEFWLLAALQVVAVRATRLRVADTSKGPAAAP